MKADIELVEEVKAGQVLAFSKLVERHQRALLRLCVRFMKDVDRAEDIVQESFVKAYQKIHMFEGRSSFKNWLFQIAVNTAKNKLRSVKNHSSLENVEISVSSEAHQKMESADLKEIIRAQIDKLPARQRTALILRAFEDMSFKEIAKVMNCPYDTAKANYRHAILKLRYKFEENESLKNWDFGRKDIDIKNRYTEVDR